MKGVLLAWWFVWNMTAGWPDNPQVVSTGGLGPFASAAACEVGRSALIDNLSRPRPDESRGWEVLGCVDDQVAVTPTAPTGLMLQKAPDPRQPTKPDPRKK